MSDDQNNTNQPLSEKEQLLQQEQNRKNVEQALKVLEIKQKQEKIQNDLNNARGIEKDLLEKIVN